MNYCNENPMNRLDNTEYFKKIENKVNNYINPYAIYDDTDFNWLIQFVMFLGLVYIFLKFPRT